MEQIVSAIITTYKREPAIVCRAVNSILGQTYKNIEIIIVDDSPDSYPLRNQVQEAVMQIAPEAKYIFHETNQGACVARNTGLSAASGQFVAYLDDDDEWMPDKIQKQIAVMAQEKTALVYCGHVFCNENSMFHKTILPKLVKGDVYEALLKENFIGSTSFPLIRTTAIREVGGFDVLMESAQDYDVWLRLAERYDVDYVADPLVIYHIHEGEQITKNYRKKISGLERINQKYRGALQKKPQAYGTRLVKLAPMYAGNKQIGKALSTWLAGVIRNPVDMKVNIKCFYYLLRNWCKK